VIATILLRLAARRRAVAVVLWSSIDIDSCPSLRRRP
jgi:hypothetical protein